MASKKEIDEHLRRTLEEIGTICPRFDKRFGCWVFRHRDYPVEYAGDTAGEVIKAYPLYLRELIKQRLKGNLAVEVEQRTKGWGGKRMELEGRIWKNEGWWLAEIPSLDAMTQGRTRKEILFMVEDLVFEMIKTYLPEEEGVQVTVRDNRENTIGVTTNRAELLNSLLVKRQKTGR